MDEGYKVGAALHHVIIRTLIDTGTCPSNAELQTMAGIDETLFLDALRKLEEIHGVVLHPAECTPWVIHPFSLTPTSTYVEGKNHGWWAPCLWCGLGVATLAGGEVQIHTRLGGEAHSVVINVKDGHPRDAEYCVHFAIPPRNAWNNVHAHCAMLLPFRNEQTRETGQFVTGCRSAKWFRSTPRLRLPECGMDVTPIGIGKSGQSPKRSRYLIL